MPCCCSADSADCASGIGPAVAIPKALEQAGLKVADVGIFEINEAFASQVMQCPHCRDAMM